MNSFFQGLMRDKYKTLIYTLAPQNIKIKDSLINAQICKCGIQERKSLVCPYYLNGQGHTHWNVLFHLNPYHFSFIMEF